MSRNICEILDDTQNQQFTDHSLKKAVEEQKENLFKVKTAFEVVQTSKGKRSQKREVFLD